MLVLSPLSLLPPGLKSRLSNPYPLHLHIIQQVQDEADKEKIGGVEEDWDFTGTAEALIEESPARE